jgi:hypothetical protein
MPLLSPKFIARMLSACHHGMAHPQVAEGDGLQIRRIATNILNK